MQPQEDNLPNFSLYDELKERGVLRMAAWYIASAWVSIQVVQTVQQAFYLPPWLLTFAVILALGGFPIALLLAWHFDITPDARGSTTLTASGSPRSWKVVTLSLIAAVGLLSVAFYVSPARDALQARRQPKILCAGGGIAPCRVATTMDAHRFVVLPLAHEAGVEPTLLNGQICARLIGDGLAQWQDMKMADPLRLEESIARLAPELRMNIPVDSGVAIARELGAGKLIMGRLSKQGDSTRVEAILYDAQSGDALNRATVLFTAGSKEAGSEFAVLARKLVVRDGELSVSEPVAYSTTSYAAMFAYDSAWKSIRDWNLPEADRYFRRALFFDDKFSYAHLWLSHVMLWRADTTAQWLEHAQRARADSMRLDMEGRLLARGMASLAEHAFADACSAFNAAIARDSANFHAWFGLGECLRRDNTVAADAGSPSGFSFASSYEAAIRAHRRALQLVPAFNQAFVNLGSSRFGSLLFLYANAYRRGVGRDGVEYAAFPELRGDSTAFVPYPLREWSSMKRPATQQTLLDHHRMLLRRTAEEWAAAYPRNPRALEAFGLALEQTGELDASGDAVSALGMLHSARALEDDTSRRAHIDAATVRVLFKNRQFRQARRLASRTLKKAPRTSSAEARQLAGLAGLVGRPQEMARLLVITAPDFEYDRPRNGETVEIPQDLASTTARLLAYGYFGGPVDSLRPLMSQAHAIIDRQRDAARRQLLHQATLDRAARITFPTLGADEVLRGTGKLNLMLGMQRDLLAGRMQPVSDSLAMLAERQRAIRPGDMSADGVLTQTQLLLATRQRDAAKQLLDSYLDNLHDLAASQFRQPYQPVTVVRLMAMRAELAGSDRDIETARKWSRAVVDLWSDGDELATSTLRRMRILAHLR